MRIVTPPFRLLPLIASLLCLGCRAQRIATPPVTTQQQILPGAERLTEYLPLLRGKRVGIFANHTSVVAGTHLVDTLLRQGVDIRVIFGPEHGFRGSVPDGVKIEDYKDERTGIRVVSLYGSKRRPSAEDLSEVDMLVFDIQDVGTRFYTYISSMQEYLEAALEHNKPLLLLDRPNPNGFYVDGPVLDLRFKSFVGMQPIPINYGMTMGEYAKMLLGENMLSEKAVTSYRLLPENRSDAFRVIPCKNYTHKSRYNLPVSPSPNLKSMQAIYLYPSTCLFEGTALSEGRGTDHPFQLFGHPDLPTHLYAFTPEPNEGSKKSKHFGKRCYGWFIDGSTDDVLRQVDNRIQLKWLLDAYRIFPDKDSFFLKSNSFQRLSGTDELMQQIKAGKTEAEIRSSWEPKLGAFKAIRKKYLLYEDFE
ncbi:MAG: hypothetical protein RJA57_1863 [Bacteroidota bacterium]|jgi:uncharacterized protein YbbC (DUF1343 family)